MEWVKTTAKTVPEAIDLALDNLGVDESEAEIEVLEEPKSSFLGLRTKGVARVQARIKPRPIRSKQVRERKNHKRKGTNGKGGNRRDRGSSSGEDSQSRNADSGSRSNNRRNRNGHGGKTRSDSDRGANRQKSDKNDRSSGNKSANGRNQSPTDSGSDNDRKKRTGRNDSSNATNLRAQRSAGERDERDSAASDGHHDSTSSVAAAASTPAHDRKPQNPQQNKSATTKSAPEQETPVDEVANHLEQFLSGLTDAFGLDGEVVIDDSEENTLIAVVQGQHGLMVGPKGRTLDAIQELARISAQRTAPSSVRIKVDVGGYRAKRNEALAEFARKAADKAVDNGCEVALEPMTPADRKIVHDALTDDRRVETRSVGQEPRRKVLVVPLVGSGRNDDEEE